MSILTDSLPTTIKIDGAKYPINTDFRTSIKFELLTSDGIDDEERIIEALRLYYGEYIPENVQEAINQILWFYAGGKELSSNGNDEKTYFFDNDDEYIYSAFKDQYSVDLQKIEYMHWWEFLAMFKSLKDDNEISKIIGYRAVKIDSKMSKEQKNFYRTMKRIYAPKRQKEDVDRQKELDDMLIQNPRSDNN